MIRPPKARRLLFILALTAGCVFARNWASVLILIFLTPITREVGAILGWIVEGLQDAGPVLKTSPKISQSASAPTFAAILKVGDIALTGIQSAILFGSLAWMVLWLFTVHANNVTWILGFAVVGAFVGFWAAEPIGPRQLRPQFVHSITSGVSGSFSIALLVGLSAPFVNVEDRFLVYAGFLGAIYGAISGWTQIIVGYRVVEEQLRLGNGQAMLIEKILIGLNAGVVLSFFSLNQLVWCVWATLGFVFWSLSELAQGRSTAKYEMPIAISQWPPVVTWRTLILGCFWAIVLIPVFPRLVPLAFLGSSLFEWKKWRKPGALNIPRLPIADVIAHATSVTIICLLPIGLALWSVSSSSQSAVSWIAFAAVCLMIIASQEEFIPILERTHIRVLWDGIVVSVVSAISGAMVAAASHWSFGLDYRICVIIVCGSTYIGFIFGAARGFNMLMSARENGG